MAATGFPPEFRALAHRMVDFIADYHEGIEQHPVLSRSEPGDLLAALPERAPDEPESWDAIFGDVERLILPGLTHWQAPGFFGYFPCNASAPGVLGEMLSAGLGIQGMLWVTSPAATELETRMMTWLGRLLELPDAFLGAPGGGCIQGTASEATLIALLAARDRASMGERVAYTSTQAHSSVAKAARIAGVALRTIETDTALALDAAALRRAIDDDRAAGRIPCFVCATVGTTSSGAVDPLRSLGSVLEGSGIWLHVDAAWAGAACICPEFRPLLDGVEHADSVCFNPHKWLLTNFDCSAFWSKDRAAVVRALGISPEYLKNRASEEQEVIDFRDWQIPLGRRFRALKLWFVMRHYGRSGLQAHIRGGVRLAQLFENLVKGDERFELAAPRRLSLVCFRVRGDDAQNRALLESVNRSGRAFLSHTTLPDAEGIDRYTLRFCVGSPATTEDHVRVAWAAIAAAP
ncbi:MAG: aminotransferase class V-fold PLP-dependent enzyme [Planctomycetota bacterium]|jgi:aromatic-L-amino-acid decarboxylase